MTEVQRFVQDNLLVSPGQPAIRIKVMEDLRYIGSLTFDIQGLAEAETFFFAEVDEHNRNWRQFFVQFEHFHAHVAHSYRYPSTDLVHLGAHDYQADVACWDTRQADPDSDTATIAAYMRGQGYEPIGEMTRLRLVRVLGEDRRAEILFIYAEAMASHGFGCEDVVKVEGIMPAVRQRGLLSFEIIGEG